MKTMLPMDELFVGHVKRQSVTMLQSCYLSYSSYQS